MTKKNKNSKKGKLLLRKIFGKAAKPPKHALIVVCASVFDPGGLGNTVKEHNETIQRALKDLIKSGHNVQIIDDMGKPNNFWKSLGIKEKFSPKHNTDFFAEDKIDLVILGTSNITNSSIGGSAKTLGRQKFKALIDDNGKKKPQHQMIASFQPVQT